MTRLEGFRTPAERKEYCWHLPHGDQESWERIMSGEPLDPDPPEVANVRGFAASLEWLYWDETRK